MDYLLDTGILLRLVDVNDAWHPVVRKAIGTLGDQEKRLVIATQNMAEFCNVTTRPVTNNGLGLSPSEALELLERDVESICGVVAELDTVYGVLKRLVATYGVSGKQIHDARLVAIMLCWQIKKVLTLNERDFRRYESEGIVIVTPNDVIASVKP